MSLADRVESYLAQVALRDAIDAEKARRAADVEDLAGEVFRD
jgi:hypothetical protein